MWFYALSFVASLVLSYAMAPKPQSQPKLLPGEFKIPTADEGREIPVLFGIRDIDSPNIVWYGDFAAEAIKKKGGKKG
jgi:hypothetical protein